MRLILIGPPGVGKGTQAKLVQEKFSIPQISTGDILRDALRAGSAIGRRAKTYMEKGELVPDDVILDLVRDRLSKKDAKKGFILDGFPRNATQARTLESLLAEMQSAIDHVLYFEAEDAVVINRILGRRRAEGGERLDDDEETIANRLRVYRSQTEPLVDYFQQKGLLRRISALATVEEVFEAILRALERGKNSSPIARSQHTLR